MISTVHTLAPGDSTANRSDGVDADMTLLLHDPKQTRMTFFQTHAQGMTLPAATATASLTTMSVTGFMTAQMREMKLVVVVSILL